MAGAAVVAEHAGMSHPLFRSEAIAHRQRTLAGEILLTQTPAQWLSVLLLGAVVTGGVVLLATASYARVAEVAGALRPEKGLIQVLATQGGVVVERHAAEGQQVTRDAVLFRLSSDRQQAVPGGGLGNVAALLRNRRDNFLAEQGQLQVQTDLQVVDGKRRWLDVGRELEQIEQQMSLQQQRVALAVAAVQRYHALQQTGFVATAQLQDRQAELLDQQQRLNDLQRTRMTLDTQRTALESEWRALQVRSRRELLGMRRDLAGIEQQLTENELRRELVVVAPVAGTVSAVTAEAGQFVAAGEAVASIVPAGSHLEAELYVPSRAAGFLHVGAEVWLRYQAYPHQKFGQQRGVIREISRTTLPMDQLAKAAVTPASEPTYRARVTLTRQSVTVNGVSQPLKPGMRLAASVVLEKRRLYQWLLVPWEQARGRWL